MAAIRFEGRGSRAEARPHQPWSGNPQIWQIGLVRESGQALVETGLALVWFLLILLGGLNFFFYDWDSWKLQEMAREMAGAAIDAPSEDVARRWLAQRSTEEVRAKDFMGALDRVDLAFPDGGFGPGQRIEVHLEAQHRFLFPIRPVLESAPLRATASGLVKPNRNWEQ